MTHDYAEVIGDPINHSKSPLIHNFWLKKLGIKAEYQACHVQANELPDYFTARRQDAHWRGCNITIPHKERAINLIDQLWPKTPEIGAINTVIKQDGQLLGANTDIEGVIGPISALGESAAPAIQNIAIIGAGGAARAAAAGIHMYFPNWPISFLARRVEQAEAIAQLIDIKSDIRPISEQSLRGITLLINASPLGMVGKAPLELALDQMIDRDISKIVFDMVYAPLETQLLYQAKQAGFATIDGLVMLLSQAAQAFEFIFGQSAPREYDSELRALLIK
jgi:shikimate dehydrogenase